MAGVLSKCRLKNPSSQRDDSYSSSQRNDSHGTFHMTRNIPYNKENKGIYYSHIGSSFFCAKTTKIDLHQLLSLLLHSFSLYPSLHSYPETVGSLRSSRAHYLVLTLS